LAASADFVRRIKYAIHPYASCMVNNTLFVRGKQLAAAHGRHTTINHIDVYKRIIRTSKWNVIKTLHHQNSSNIKLEIRVNGQNQLLMMSYI
jgi:hypothetical protein